jgi:hypothetical protein
MSPSTDWKEIIPDGEAERFEQLAEQLRALQRRRASRAAPGRALHIKAQAGVSGELTVLPDLPEHARVGLFAAPATFRAYVRFSNGGGQRLPDKKPDVRGVAIKVLGVPGPKIIPGLEAATTQDFLLIQSPATPFRDADEFVWFVRAAASPALLLPRAIGRLGPVRALRVIRELLRGVSRPVASVATSRYWSALPIKYGAHAAKYALVPHASDDAATTPKQTPELHDELARRLARGPVVYDFRVQFFVDEARTPIESSTQEWLEADAPFVTVARLTLPQQDLASPDARALAETIEALSFDPWHTTADFRPLGSMMRARNAAYRLSTQERGAAPEPT